MKNSDPLHVQMALLCRGRKCTTFDDAPVAILDARARVLREQNHYEPCALYDDPYRLLHPTDAFSDPPNPYLPQFFVLELDPEHRYLVNTQGYNYCRYICRVVILEMDT